MHISQTIHVAVRCDFCGTHNELTGRDVADDEIVHCSHCGGILGDIGHLRESKGEAPKASARR